jgi:hypothetical protein
LRLRGCHRGSGRQVILNGVIEILLAGGLFGGQGRVAIYVQFSSVLHRLRVGQLRARLRQLPQRLIEHCLKRPRIDFEKQLALLDERAFLIALLHQVAADLRAHVGVGEPVECADPFAKNRDVLLRYQRDRHIRRSGLRACRVFRPHHAVDHANHQQSKHHGYPDFVFR